jgi:hypothetical protein
MKKKLRSAAEFAAELKQDREYMAKQVERATRLVEAEAAEQAAMEFLASRGYVARSLSALVQRYAPIPGDLAESLLDLLAEVDHPNVIESIVRALGAVRGSLDPSPLIRLFEQTESETLRWAIANTLAEARPTVAGPWILRAIRESAYGKAREMLALAGARTNHPEVVNPVLVDLLTELPSHAAMALRESGTAAELPALERAYSSSSGWQRKEIGRALSVVRKRASGRL